MGVRIDKVTVTISGAIEFEGQFTTTFDLPPDDSLVPLLREWHERKLLADAIAAGPADIGFL